MYNEKGACCKLLLTSSRKLNNCDPLGVCVVGIHSFTLDTNLRLDLG